MNATGFSLEFPPAVHVREIVDKKDGCQRFEQIIMRLRICISSPGQRTQCSQSLYPSVLHFILVCVP